VKSRGSQRQAALATGLSQSVISRILDRDGYAKNRAPQKARRADVTFPDVTSADLDELVETNVVKLRPKRRRPDWRPKEPQRREVRKWF
jgi:hypothetical protein